MHLGHYLLLDNCHVIRYIVIDLAVIEILKARVAGLLSKRSNKCVQWLNGMHITWANLRLINYNLCSKNISNFLMKHQLHCTLAVEQINNMEFQWLFPCSTPCWCWLLSWCWCWCWWCGCGCAGRSRTGRDCRRRWGVYTFRKCWWSQSLQPEKCFEQCQHSFVKQRNWISYSIYH